MNETPSANRTHIAFFGRCNAGKSSLVNAVTNQNLAIVSETKGTTTDPVYKAMELLPLGPVVIIDTPGIDDEGGLGEQRVNRARQVLNKTDIAVLVLDVQENVSPRSEKRVYGIDLYQQEEELIGIFKEKNVPYIIALNKSDLFLSSPSSLCDLRASVPLCEDYCEILPVSAKTGFNIQLLKEKIAALVPTAENNLLVADLVKPFDLVVLVIPIDKAAPKGRLILPQQQVIRSILDSGAAVLAVREGELKETLDSIDRKPALVITDSQVFDKVNAAVPPDVPLTSFSILFARNKGVLETAIRGVVALDTINDGDKILICEGCTHHRQCDDIGTVKLPLWIKNYTKKSVEFVFCSGGDFPKDISAFKMIIHCGACMLNNREVQHRCLCAQEQNIPFTNYGITIAFINGILKRSISMFNFNETEK